MKEQVNRFLQSLDSAMRALLAILFSVLFNPSIAVKSTGPALASNANGYSSLTGGQKSPFLLDNDVKRTLLEEPEDQCTECSTLKQNVYNDALRAWLVDDPVLDRNGVDIQCIVSCANASDTIMLPMNRVLKPRETITINKPLTVTGFHEDGSTSEGTEPAAENKSAISCPEGSDKSVFNIQSGGVTIADLEIRDCSLETDDSPIVIENCKDNEEGVRIRQVDFVNNTHKSQLVVINVTKSVSCGTLDVTNVNFKDNQADGNVAVLRVGFNTNMPDIRIENTTRSDNGTAKAFLLITTETQSDKLTVDGVVARGNQMRILKAGTSAIEILNSDFSGNEVRSEDASMFQFSSAPKIMIRNCTFENNSGAGREMIKLVSNQSIEIHDTNFTNNSGFGSLISSTASKLDIWNSRFTANNGTSNGGVMYLSNSTATMNESIFNDSRSEENGGSVYALNDSTLTIQGSHFTNNAAIEGGCFWVESSTIEISKSKFERNNANLDGGALILVRSGVVCNDSSFTGNNAWDDGGAFDIEEATYVKWQNVSFTSNFATFGSAVRIVKSRKNVTWKEVRFCDGVLGVNGAGAYIDDSNVTIDNATFMNNTALYGGAIYAQKFNITIKNATFEKNIAYVMGGAISGDNGTISLKNATFVENNSSLGGALHFFNTTLHASEILLSKNNASEGGGLRCSNSNVTIQPRPNANDKQPKPEQSYPNSSFGIHAHNNRGLDSGGVIDAKDSNMIITYGNFSNNTAPYGGAIQVTSNERKTLRISSSNFTANVAVISGGSLAASSANEGNISINLSFSNFSRCIADQGGAVFLTSVNAVIEGCKLVNNTATEGGAALFQKNVEVIWEGNSRSESANISIEVKNCSFEGNRAHNRGGALALRGEAIVTRSSDTSDHESVEVAYAEEGFNVSLKCVNVTRNRARHSGGGVYGEAVALDIQNVEAIENNASQGGGVYLMRSTANIGSSNISINQAESSGSGIMMARQSNGTISKTSFTDNKISEDGDGEGGGLSLSGSSVRAENLTFKRNNASYGGGVSLASGSKRTSIAETLEVDSSFLCFGCTFSENKASKSGGGLNIQTQDREVPVMAQLDRCQFTHNSASVFGGGIHFVRTFNRTKCTMDWTSCSHLVILDSSFTDNTAKRGGGSLISNDRERVLFSCSQSTDNANPIEFINVTRAKSLRANQQELCPQWIDCKGNKSDCPLLVSSYVRSCNITEVREGRKSEPSGTSIQINETVPGERLPDIFIECYDEFGHVSKSGDDSFTATLKSKEEGSLMGIFVTDLKEGFGNITGVINPPKEGFNSSYSYELEISFSLGHVKPITVLINVRECRMNEQKEDEGVQCKQCDAAQYNFDPMNKACKSCDDTLNCAGTYVFPEDDYWHSSPCHVPAQKCLTSYACEKTADLQAKINNQDVSNISAALKGFSCDFSNASREEYQKLQCKEGYEGVLCGSCNKGYGRSLSFACTECRDAAFNVFVLVSVCVWLAAIAAITIRGSMTIEEILLSKRKRLHDVASRRRLGFEVSIPDESEIQTQEDRRTNENIRIISSRRRRAHRRLLLSASRSTDASDRVGHNLPTTSIATTVETPEEINNFKSSQLAKWKLCEVLKVTVNFLQAMSVAAVLNVEWKEYMLTMYKLSAFAGGGSTALVTGAVQCFPWWSGTRYATYAGLVSGLVVPIFVILCIVALFAFLAYMASKEMYYFVKRSVLGALAISYFSYLSITNVAVVVFDCIGVRTDDDFSSDKETRYWALDTSIKCADKDHIVFKVLGGILIALFLVGFPLNLAFILVPYRTGDGSSDPQLMTDALGFLYRAYKREFIFWESTIMLRKALLSAIAVFSYHLGGHSQGLLTSCILFVCLFLQAFYKPYRAEFKTINNIESLSLLISGLTFTLAQFFMKDRTNEAVKVALAVFLMISIIGFFVYSILRLLACFIDVLRADLRVIGALVNENEKSWRIVGTWAASRLGLSERPGGDDEDDGLGDVELGSMQDNRTFNNTSEPGT